MSAGKDAHAKMAKAHQLCQESGRPQGRFGRRIALTWTPNRGAKERSGQKIKDHSDAKELTHLPSVKTGSGIGQNRWNHADGNQEGDSDQ